MDPPVGAMGRHAHDAERLLTPADVEDLLLRVAAEQMVSPLSMDAAYDPPPLLKLRERAAATGEGRAATYTIVLLRAMCASDEPSLEPQQSIQWTAHAVVRVIARLARAHPSPEVFEPLLAGMHAVQAEHPRGGIWYPMRFALGWLLLAELRSEPRGGATSAVSRWAKRLFNAPRDAALIGATEIRRPRRARARPPDPDPPGDGRAGGRACCVRARARVRNNDEETRPSCSLNRRYHLSRSVHRRSAGRSPVAHPTPRHL